MALMKSLAYVLVAVSILAGCQNESKLSGNTGDLEKRIKVLEDANKKYAEALDWLQKVYDDQKKQAAAQQQEREENEPDPNAIFAVDISQSIKGGLVEGPATGAPVTIVEAWDFA